MRYRTLVLITLLSMASAALYRPFFAFTQTAPGATEVKANAKEDTTELDRQIEEKRNKIKELEKSIEEYKKKVAEKQREAVSFSNQLSILNNRVAEVKLDIQDTQLKLETISLELEALSLEIQEREINIAREQKLLSRLVKTLHEENTKGYLEILLAYHTFSDFFNRIQYLETIQRDMGRSVKTIRLAKEEIEVKKKATEERQDAYKALEKRLKDRQLDLGEQVDYKEVLLDQTKSSEATYRTLLNNLRSQYQQVENEIEGIEKEVRRRLQDSKKLQDLPTGSFGWPSAGRYITAYFHDPDYPFRRVFEHNAIDIRQGQGTSVKAAGSGYVARAKTCESSKCYSYVMIIHSGGIATVYGHLSSISVTEDQFVTAGDTIGRSGGTPGTIGAGPFVTGPHLHFEVRKNGIPVNPLDYLPK